MEKIIRLTESDLNRIVKRVIKEEDEMEEIMNDYFDMKFEDTVEDIRPYGYDYDDWYGIWKGGNLVIGQPEGSSDNTWYSDGTYFGNDQKMFGISRIEFNNYMRKYLLKKFPNIRIDTIY